MTLAEITARALEGEVQPADAMTQKATVVAGALRVAEQRAELARAEHLRRRLEALPEASPERVALERHYTRALLAAAALRALGKGTR